MATSAREKAKRKKEYPARRVVNRLPTHPGALLRDTVLPALGRSKSEIADLIGVSRQMLYAILNEKTAVTPAMALKLGKLCGNGPDLWINMQTRHDLAVKARELEAEIARIPTVSAA